MNLCFPLYCPKEKQGVRFSNLHPFPQTPSLPWGCRKTQPLSPSLANPRRRRSTERWAVRYGGGDTAQILPWKSPGFVHILVRHKASSRLQAHHGPAPQPAEAVTHGSTRRLRANWETLPLEVGAPAPQHRVATPAHPFRDPLHYSGEF